MSCCFLWWWGCPWHWHQFTAPKKRPSIPQGESQDCWEFLVMEGFSALGNVFVEHGTSGSLIWITQSLSVHILYTCQLVLEFKIIIVCLVAHIICFCILLSTVGNLTQKYTRNIFYRCNLFTKPVAIWNIGFYPMQYLFLYQSLFHLALSAVLNLINAI